MDSTPTSSEKTTRMKHVYVLLLLLQASTILPVQAQVPVTQFIITNIPSPRVRNAADGWNNTGEYSLGTSYMNYYGQKQDGSGGFERKVMGFAIGPSMYFSIPRPNDLPFDQVVLNRHPRMGGDTINMLYEYSRNDGTNLYYEPGYLPNLEDVINSYVCNRGVDNLFSNTPTTQANIERLDMIINAGVVCINPTRQGFLIVERNGNDPFKVTPIRRLNASNRVAQFGPMIDVAVANWGRVGPSFVTRVMSRRTGSQPYLRPKQDIGSQTISGVFISFAAMGLNVGDSLYGISLYANDVTPTMDLLRMGDFPVNTDGTAAGGLDMMAGGGYFIESGSLPVRIWNEGIQRQPNGIRLTWNAIHQTPARYQIIERATENGEYRAIASIDFQQNGRSFYQYIDRSTSNRASYRYRIRAVDGRGQQDSYSQELRIAAISHSTETRILNPVVRAGEAVWLEVSSSPTSRPISLRWINDAGQQCGNPLTLASNARHSLQPPAELRGWASLVVEEGDGRKVFRVRVL